jgi:hypothetical protein
MDDSKTRSLVSDLIGFLQKWGLWHDTTVLANGNRYSYSAERSSVYGDLNYTEFEQNVNPEDYTRFSNPEHILDMVYEGPLYMLLSYGTYETRKSEISEEAWDYIFDHSDLLEDYLYEKYECNDVSDLLVKILEDKFDNSDYTAWDPLVFDTWEEYQEFVNGEAYETGEEELTPTYQRYGTYDEYLTDMEISESLSIEDIEPIWEKMVSDAKTEYIRGCASDEAGIISVPEIAGYVKSAFDKIFDRYGLWYDFGFSWSLTCYKK